MNGFKMMKKNVTYLNHFLNHYLKKKHFDNLLHHLSPFLSHHAPMGRWVSPVWRAAPPSSWMPRSPRSTPPTSPHTARPGIMGATTWAARRARGGDVAWWCQIAILHRGKCGTWCWTNGFRGTCSTFVGRQTGTTSLAPVRIMAEPAQKVFPELPSDFCRRLFVNPLNSGTAQEGQTPGKDQGWCAEAWCYVDPCNCELDEPATKVPEEGGYMPHASYMAELMIFYFPNGTSTNWGIY